MPNDPKPNQATDLSVEAFKHRERQKRLNEALAWVRAMNRTFKGQRGSLGRDGYARLAIEKFKLGDE